MFNNNNNDNTTKKIKKVECYTIIFCCFVSTRNTPAVSSVL